jgi:hypothetical protein
MTTMSTANKRSLFVFACVFAGLLIVQPAWYYWAVCSAAAAVTAWIALDERRRAGHG